MLTEDLLRDADNNYQSFPDFDTWKKLSVNTEKWDKYSEKLKAVITNSPKLLSEAQEHIKRAAAIETGLIEGLYQVDRGFTITATAEVAIWQAALNQKEETTRSLIEAQLKAYDYVLDFATKSTPIGEAYIRELHKVICEAQKTYKVHTQVGTQDHELALGEYKKNSNHVIQSNGAVHSYAPVHKTSSEMHKLCEELNSHEFQNSHTVLQASYIHYAFVVIHPFADGNGRVARTLASIYTYRSHSIPLLITDDTKKAYYDSLEYADNGSYQEFVNFVLERGVDSMRLLETSLLAAAKTPHEEITQSIRQLYVNKAGYRHDEIDNAGRILFENFVKELKTNGNGLKDKIINYDLVYTNSIQSDKLKENAYRFPIEGGHKEIQFSIFTKEPANAKVVRRYYLLVPINPDEEDDILIRCIETGEVITARVNELLPVYKISIDMRLIIIIRRILSEMTEKLLVLAKQQLAKKGYQ